jgi:hydroxymethylglutaryl-CoA reductase
MLTEPVIPRLPGNFRKLSIAERRAAVSRAYGPFTPDIAKSIGDDATIADAMVESAIGFLPVPLGIAAGFIIDGEAYDIPMAVEEPSVIAAATFAARIIGEEGGFSTWATDPLMTAQVFLENVPKGGESEIERREPEIRGELDAVLASMEKRGGGYRGLSVTRTEEAGIVRIDIRVDVRDSMGANLLDTAAERAGDAAARISGGSVLMSILSNDASLRRAGAQFSVPVWRLARAGFSGEETARRIEAASRVALEEPTRAVTHNKGVMNGIDALALATGNDVRAIEAGIHHWACRDGKYRGVTTFQRKGGRLEGSIDAPLVFATVGGSVGFHPAASLALRILRNPDGRRLSRIAAALGLAQNFAALFALVTEGIQAGHMRHHLARRESRADG